MSAYIGKKSDNTNNIVHFTREVTDKSIMGNGPLSSTSFHSENPYVEVDYISYFTPDWSTAYWFADFNMQSLKYTGGPVSRLKPFLLLMKVVDVNIGEVWVSLASPNYTYSQSYYDTMAFSIANIGTHDITLNNIYPGNYVDITSQSNGSTAVMPSEIMCIGFKNSITNFDSVKMQGNIQINNQGISVGGGNIFDKRFIMLSGTPRYESTSRNILKIYTGGPINAETNLSNSDCSYLHICGQEDAIKYNVDIASEEVVVDTVSNGTKTIISKNFSYLQKFSVINLSNVDPRTDYRFSIATNNAISDRIGNTVKMNIGSLGVISSSSYLILHLKIISAGNAHTWYINTIIKSGREVLTYWCGGSICEGVYLGVANSNLHLYLLTNIGQGAGSQAYAYTYSNNQSEINISSITGWIAKVGI